MSGFMCSKTALWRKTLVGGSHKRAYNIMVTGVAEAVAVELKRRGQIGDKFQKPSKV